jgi:2-polyprenyl-6-hydroxyphenyl methylase / 3-demethylubiquinone-9 3-methyltransferase
MPVDNGIYDRHAASWWDEEGLLQGLRATMNPARVGYFARVVASRLRLDRTRASLLDVGCGGGFLSEEFARLGFRVTGVDPSAESIDVARRHAAEQELEIDYRVGRGETLPFADGSFDVVICCDVLEHVTDLDQVVAEIGRVLAPGGLFLFDTINRTKASRMVVIKMMQEWRWSSFVPPDLHDWNRFIKPNELDGAMWAAGLQVCELVGLKPAVKPLAMIRSLRAHKQGRITCAQLGRDMCVREDPDLSVSYMGYGVRSHATTR